MVAAAAPPRPIALAQLSLRRNERAMVVGGVNSGKSTLADQLGREFVMRYRKMKARRLLVDSKPRYRAQWTVNGTPAKRRYRDWDHGPVVPDSVVVDDPGQLKLVWSLGYPTAIVQGSGDELADVWRMMETIKAFNSEARAGRPQLLQIDETMDFYHPNGSPKLRGGSDPILRSARALRERGGAGLYCSQRTRGIPTQLLEEMTRLYAFILDYEADAKRFLEMGCPPFVLPQFEHEFKYWSKVTARREVFPSADGERGYRLAL